MNEKLYEALEVCLNALETGVDIESVLTLYPQLADELRPVLEAAIEAQSLAIPAVPEAAMKRGRARVLQHAAGMRKSAPKAPSRWLSVFAFPRLATSLAITLLFLVSGTGLVNASAGTIPGDNLYPVKRSWEDLRLFFMFSPEGREGLESEFEQERLDEISALLTKGRKETIAFAGLITAQNSTEWKVSGISVMLTASSHLPADAVSVGAPVMVIGHTNADGFVEADTIDLLGPGTSLPPLEPSQMELSEAEETHDFTVTPSVNGNQPPEQMGKLTYEFQGVVKSMNGSTWTINGQDVNVEFAENSGPVSVGEIVEFKGYYSTDGQFIVTKIEVKSSGLFDRIQLDGNRKNSNDSSNSKSSGSSEDGGGSSSSNDNSSDDSHDDSGGD